MRVLIIDKTGVMDSAHERCSAIASRPDIDLHLLTPVEWIESGRLVRWQPRTDARYTVHTRRGGFRDNYARGFYWGGISSVIRDCRPDVVQILEEPWSFFAAQAAFARDSAPSDAPFLFYTWENIFRQRTFPSRISFVFRWIEGRSYREFQGGVCATETARDILTRKGFSKPTAVIPYGIDPSFSAVSKVDRENLKRQNNLPQDFLIGYVGRLLPMKGIDTLVEAFSSLAEGRLVIVGTGPDEARLNALVDSKGLRDRVTFVGSVAHERIPEYMRALDVLVLPSRTTPLWMEQLGRVLLEAMAAGTAVVGSSSGAIPEVVADAGLIFTEGNAKELSDRLSILEGNQSLLESLRVKGRERVEERFTWSRFSEDLVAFWRAL